MSWARSESTPACAQSSRSIAIVARSARIVAANGGRGCALAEPFLLDPVHPPQHGGDPAARPRGLGEREDQVGGAFGVAAPLGVLERELGPTLLGAPRRGAPVQCGHQLGLAPFEL